MELLSSVIVCDSWVSVMVVCDSWASVMIACESQAILSGITKFCDSM